MLNLIIDQNNCVWPIDIGPRNGGNMIPDLLGYIYDIDVVEMSIKAAMNENFDVMLYKGKSYYASHNLHSNKSGKLKHIRMDSKLEPYVIKSCIYKKEGDTIEFFDNASKALGIIFMKFNSKEEMNDILENICDLIEIFIE